MRHVEESYVELLRWLQENSRLRVVLQDRNKNQQFQRKFHRINTVAKNKCIPTVNSCKISSQMTRFNDSAVNLF